MYTIISREGCTRCNEMKALLTERGIPYEVKMMDELTKIEKFDYMNSAKKAGQMSLPIILNDGVFVPTVEVENQYK